MSVSFENQAFGKTGLNLPPIIFGTSCLGNIYEVIPYEQKLEMARTWFSSLKGTVVLDSAGKYGAGLALEMIGKTLRDLGISPDQVVISNKLGWKRVPLTTPEPTFEVGVWEGLEHDAVQCISYDGMMECFEQGCEILGEPYKPKLLSLHDPDEYLAAAKDSGDRDERMNDIREAYKALKDLKDQGKTNGVGVGSKDWRIIDEISKEIDLDWVMFACSLTPYTHDPELFDLIDRLKKQNVAMVNSAVYNSGFLLGGKFFDYRIPDPEAEPSLFEWREKFQALCQKYKVKAADVCVQFGMQVPGMSGTALSTTKVERIPGLIQSLKTHVPEELWKELIKEEMIYSKFPFSQNGIIQ